MQLLFGVDHSVRCNSSQETTGLRTVLCVRCPFCACVQLLAAAGPRQMRGPLQVPSLVAVEPMQYPVASDET